jgi:hypothetical protein
VNGLDEGKRKNMRERAGEDTDPRQTCLNNSFPLELWGRNLMDGVNPKWNPPLIIERKNINKIILMEIQYP